MIKCVGNAIGIGASRAQTNHFERLAQKARVFGVNLFRQSRVFIEKLIISPIPRIISERLICHDLHNGHPNFRKTLSLLSQFLEYIEIKKLSFTCDYQSQTLAFPQPTCFSFGAFISLTTPAKPTCACIRSSRTFRMWSTIAQMILMNLIPKWYACIRCSWALVIGITFWSV